VKFEKPDIDQLESLERFPDKRMNKLNVDDKKSIAS
jgi:hypothetical protein